MPKKIAIVAVRENYAEWLRGQLQLLFKDNLEIEIYSYDTNTINKTINADSILVTATSLYGAVKKFIFKGTKVITLGTTITDVQYSQIASMPAGSQVLIVNDTYEATFQTITLLQNLNIDHLDLIPYYPEMENVHKLDIAITPGETRLVPSFIKHVIDIGHRVIGADTLTDIAESLNLEHLLKEDHFVRYLQSIKTVNSDPLSESRLLSLLNIMDDGIIFTDNSGIIHACNEKALSILGEEKNILNENIIKAFPQMPFRDISKNPRETEIKLIKLNGYDVSVKAVPVITSKRLCGSLFIINRFAEKEKSQHKLRLQLLDRGHKTRYTFADIISEDTDYIQLKALAEKMAKSSDASVLITGESGTGKEMFAQAIHNASRRKEGPFVAVNCAALPENLLESELFGYEEGAFTGARRGGKVGLFELAHKGTIFLDEIGEMDYKLQSRLLRILEERKVMRIGGDSIIHVDIRVLAATNTDLWHMIEEGKFRKDLFYRLCVLPLELTPLRERQGDIPLLFEYMKKSIKAEFHLTLEAEKILYAYPWYGNVRELKNCIEYLSSADKGLIDLKDLPSMIKKQITPSTSRNEIAEDLSEFLDAIKSEDENYTFVLECLYSCYLNKLRTGRRSILMLAQESDVILTEAQVRKMLSKLELYGLAILSNGRGGGTTITTLGVKALRLIKSIKLAPQ